MIIIDANDLVARLATGDGRSILLTHRAALFDTSDGWHRLLVMLDSVPDSSTWGVLDLLRVAEWRSEAELARCCDPNAAAILEHLNGAIEAETERLGGRAGVMEPTCLAGAPSPYPWTVAVIGESDLPLCPDPESRGLGVTPEAVMVLAAKLLSDALVTRPSDRALMRGRNLVSATVLAERRRLRHVRREAGESRPRPASQTAAAHPAFI